MPSFPLHPPAGASPFGPIPLHAETRLKEAAVALRSGDAARCARLLWEAHRLAPRALPVFHALYRYYFERRALAEAERTAWLGLSAAAHLLKLPQDWREVGPASASWNTRSGPAFFYLFTMKALAFIHLRQGRPADAIPLLEKLELLDPDDRAGHRVVSALARQFGP